MYKEMKFYCKRPDQLGNKKKLGVFQVLVFIPCNVPTRGTFRNILTETLLDCFGNFCDVFTERSENRPPL